MTIKTKKAKADARDLRSVTSPEFTRALVEGSTSLLESVVKEVFDSRHDSFVFQCANRLREFVSSAKISESEVVATSDWVEIESLSRLRGIVGGRFENTKKRWVAAGFPLREHRGDKAGQYTMDEAGWIELSNWIVKQGFETRLCPDKQHCLFELRKANGS